MKKSREKKKEKKMQTNQMSSWIDFQGLSTIDKYRVSCNARMKKKKPQHHNGCETGERVLGVCIRSIHTYSYVRQFLLGKKELQN